METSSSDDRDQQDPRSADLVDAHVGSRIRLRRILIGMSQESLASKVGLTFQQIQKYEKATNRVSASRLYHFSIALGVPVQFFYDEMPPSVTRDETCMPRPEEEGTQLSDFLRSREGIEASMALSKVSNKGVRRALVELMELLAGQEEPSVDKASR